MSEFFSWIEMIYLNFMGVCLSLLKIMAVPAAIAVVLYIIFGEPEPTSKTNKKSATQSTGMVCDWDTADEAQRRFMAESIRTHEESVRMAAKEAWDAHTTACDLHQTAVDMHNDFACNSCDPWF